MPQPEHALEIARWPHMVMIRLEDSGGWEIGALSRERVFPPRYRGISARAQGIGPTGPEDWGTTLAAPFAKAETRFLRADRRAAADPWLTTPP